MGHAADEHRDVAEGDRAGAGGGYGRFERYRAGSADAEADRVLVFCVRAEFADW